MSLPPGSKLGDYEIRRPLGAGGMGEVYLAQDAKLGRSVAIKVLSGQVASDPTRIRRFEQEARAASALSHPNVCVVHALGETADGHPFIAMEYIEGQTLRHLLQTQPPTLKAALDIAIQIAAGAGAAHAIGIVHRDLKPENVIVRQDGLVKVLDFGLAKLAPGGLPNDEATRTLVQTDSGVVMGTYTYMAPEQARGQDVDARADIWALGVMLYELVSGRVPFTGHTPSDVMVAILDREPAPLDKLNPSIPHELQRIVAKALRKDRAQRYQTIADLRLDLEALRSELQASSQDAAPLAAVTAPAPTPQPVRRESSAEYILTGLGRHKLAAAGLLVITGLAAGIVWRMRHQALDTSEPSPQVHVQRNPTRLTFGGGLQTDPTLSPDGRFLAYASDRAGNFDIWVQPVAGGDPVQITKDPNRHAAGLVTGRQHGCVSLGGEWRWPLPGAGARRPAPAAHLVRRTSSMVPQRNRGAVSAGALHRRDYGRDTPLRCARGRGICRRNWQRQCCRMATGNGSASIPMAGFQPQELTTIRAPASTRFLVPATTWSSRTSQPFAGLLSEDYGRAIPIQLEPHRRSAVRRGHGEGHRQSLACGRRSSDARLAFGRTPDDGWRPRHQRRALTGREPDRLRATVNFSALVVFSF